MKPIADIMAHVETLKTVDERVHYLTQGIDVRYRAPVAQILKYMYDKRLKFLLPEGEPPYEKNDNPNPAVLFAQLRTFYLYLEGGHPTLTQGKREFLFQKLLEQLHPSDVQLVLAIKDKKSPWKGLTKEVAKRVSPEIVL